MTAHERVVGLGYGLAAFGIWAFAPLFWKLLVHVPAVEVLAHRVIWAAIVFSLLARWQGLSPWRSWRQPKLRWVFLASAGLLATNWGVFVYAVETERVLHASLGYFINPMVSVLLGALVLGERLRRLQWFATAFAVAGVAQLAAGAGGVPWIAMVLAGSFGTYGLVRKLAPRGALEGSTLESWVMAPIGLIYVGWSLAPPSTSTLSGGDMGLLALSGPITAAPLLLFAHAARRLPLSTIGFLQYVAPTGQFLIAVVAFGEAFEAVHLRSFACIWMGVGLFSFDVWRHRVRERGA
ncbi:MAG: EamA family transporter RarD [Myxococcales bacterium FL481]|nr:MAG: EamA family transporter RarD [Myxococcales bacterium FL481]